MTELAKIRKTIREGILQARKILETDRFQILGEASFSRLLQNYERDGFIVISADRGERGPEENEALSKELKLDINRAGYGFIPTYGGYVETNIDTGEQDRVQGERSFIIPNAPYGGRTQDFDPDKLFTTAMVWARKYGQESFLYAPAGGPARFVDAMGQTVQFGPSPTMSGITFDDRKQPFYSTFAKGSQAGRPYSHIPIEADAVGVAEGTKVGTRRLGNLPVNVRPIFFLEPPPSKGSGMVEARSRTGEVFVKAETFDNLSRVIEGLAQTFLGQVSIVSIDDGYEDGQAFIRVGYTEASQEQQVKNFIPETIGGIPVKYDLVDMVIPQDVKKSPANYFFNRRDDGPGPDGGRKVGIYRDHMSLPTNISGPTAGR